MQQGIRSGFRVIALVIEREIKTECVTGDIAQLSPGPVDIRAAERTELATGVAIGNQPRQGAGELRILAHKINPIDVAVLLFRDARDAGKELVFDQCEVISGTEVDAMEIAHRPLDETGVVARGLLGDIAYRASNGPATEQGTLGPAQDLHPVAVHEVELRGHGGRVVDVVDINTDARLEREIEIVLANAADIGCLGLTESGLRGAKAGIGDGISDVTRVREPALLDVISRHRRDGDRSLLKGLGPILCRDHDLGECA